MSMGDIPIFIRHDFHLCTLCSVINLSFYEFIETIECKCIRREKETDN